MKQLQNNFTTPEQSKRLLELGVPADSADCFYSEGADIKDGEVYFEYNTEPELLPKSAITGEIILFSEYKNKYTGGFVLPCWSVGRLIEIDLICRNTKSDKGLIPRLFVIYNPNILEELVSYIERTVSEYDFSKLED